MGEVLHFVDEAAGVIGKAGPGYRLVDALDGVNDTVDASFRRRFQDGRARVCSSFEVAAGNAGDGKVGVGTGLVPEGPCWIVVVGVGVDRSCRVRLGVVGLGW